MRAVTEGFDDLVWYPAPEAVPRELLTRMAAAELVGPDGAIHSPTLRVGLYFMVEGTAVPHHCHSASEYYVVLAGQRRVGTRSGLGGLFGRRCDRGQERGWSRDQNCRSINGLPVRMDRRRPLRRLPVLRSLRLALGTSGQAAQQRYGNVITNS